MKIISFNANGIRSAAKKGFFSWLKTQNADFICIQETKAHAEDLHPKELFYPEGYVCIYNHAKKKGYSGVALYAKKSPLNIITTTNFDLCDHEGRYIQFDYEKFSVISMYFPSGTSGAERQAIKYSFLDWFETHLTNLRSQSRELIICGDYNIAHKPIDLKNWRANQKNSGFLPEERAWLDKLFGSLGFIDAFRVKNPHPDEYTWWSFRGKAREKNVGWRIDYQVVTPGLLPNISEVNIYRDTIFSDHAPLSICYDL